MENYEKTYLHALRSALTGQMIESDTGFDQPLGEHNVFIGDLPESVTDSFSVVLEPTGPGFHTDMMGRGNGVDARTVVVEVDVSIYYEHIDKNVMIEVLMDSAWWISEFLISHQKLAGATRTTVTKGTYAWGQSPDAQDDNIADAQFLGVFVLPIAVEYRRS